MGERSVICIGIDPGKHTGVALAYDGRLEAVFETDFWGAVSHIIKHPQAHIVIELPSTKSVWHNEAKSKGAIQRTGVNVGSVIREAELLVEYCKKNGRQYLTQSPKGKTNAEEFKRITGWEGRTNQHMRDAGLLVYGLKETGKR
jgi:hypothetical protein